MSASVVLVNVVGWTGMALLISAYGLVTAGRIHGTGLPFQLMNLVGGAALMVNSAYYGAWPSAVLNVVWVGIGIVGLVRSNRVQHRGELLDPVDESGPGAGPHAVGVDGVSTDPAG